MPFASEYREVYDQVYKPVCNDNGFRCWRVDEVDAPGSITKDIINGIMDADLVIADLTSKNPNVFYELGIAHCSGNKTIMTAQSTKDIPFDIGNYRVIVYGQSIAGGKKLYARIDVAIKELIKSLEQTNNPVQEVLSQRNVATLSRKKLLLEVVRVDWLKKAFREIIAKENIVYIDDLKRLDIEDLRERYGIGPAIMKEITGVMLELNVVHDVARLNEMALKYRFSPEARSSYFRHD